MSNNAHNGTADVNTDHSFEQLCLPPLILQGALRAGYLRPSPVQYQSIPPGRSGCDLMVQAKAGTGKTFAFATIVLEHIDLNNPSPQALIIAPTREIALQIRDVIRAIGFFYQNLAVQVFIGGVPIATDRATLHHACHIAVGTPGRLLSLFQEKLLSSACLRRVVLDEVDQLLVPEHNASDSNVRPDNVMDQMVRQVLALRTPDTQTIVCSATLPDDLLESLQRLLKPNAQSVLLCADTPSLKGVRQFLVDISDQLPQSSGVEHPTAAAIAAQKYATFATKSSTLVSLLSRIPFQQCVVFSNNRTRAGELVELLQASGWPARCVAGDMSQHERVDVLKALHLNQCRLLVSTDLIARGIDVRRVSLVINLDLPFDSNTYLHRVGRTGRFGSLGIAISLVDAAERVRLAEFEQTFKTHIDVLPEGSLPAEYFEQIHSTASQELEIQTDRQTAILAALQQPKVHAAKESDWSNRDVQHQSAHSAHAVEIIRKNAAGERLYCVCNEPYNEEDERPAVHCASCDDWYHLECLELNDLDEESAMQFVCAFCSVDDDDIMRLADDADQTQQTTEDSGAWKFAVEGAWLGDDGLWHDHNGFYDAEGYYHVKPSENIPGTANLQPSVPMVSTSTVSNDVSPEQYTPAPAASSNDTQWLQQLQSLTLGASVDEIRRIALQCARQHRRWLEGDSASR